MFLHKDRHINQRNRIIGSETLRGLIYGTGGSMEESWKGLVFFSVNGVSEKSDSNREEYKTELLS